MVLSIQTEEHIAAAMNCSLEAVERAIVVTWTLCPFKVARMATDLEVQYHSPVTKFRLNGLNSMNQVYT
jgi:hypothetical protein